MKKKFLIFSPSYNEISGGVVVLHKLCSILNTLGYESYLHPYIYSYELNRYNLKEFLWNCCKWSVREFFKPYRTNPAFNTPIFKGLIENKDEWVVIYPEVVFGNPLKAKNVIRWLLHQPGYHEGSIYYGKNELYFKFNSAILDFDFPGSVTSRNELKVIHYPLEYYNMEGSSSERSGTAYCLRKGTGKKIQHELSESILIDGMSHFEVAEIFKRVKTFVSYDTYTAYSIFAILCGCESVVIPDEGVSEEEWYPNPTDRYGISYGFENITKATVTAHLVHKHVQDEENRAVDNVKSFAFEVGTYFK